MRRWIPSAVALCALALPAAGGRLAAQMQELPPVQAVPQAPRPGNYYVLSDSSFTVELATSGLFGRMGDSHMIRAMQFDAHARVGAQGLNSPDTQVSVVVFTAALEVVDPGAPIEDRLRVEERMKGPDQLNVDAYPEIRLVSTALRPGKGPGQVVMTGELTIHGVTRTVTFPMTWTALPDHFAAEGQVQLKLSDFDIKPIKLGMGTVRVRDAFTLRWRALLLPAPPTPGG